MFNSIVGYHPIDAGSITFEGREISTLRTQEISRLGLLRTFQQTRVYKRMNCVENMLMSIPNRKAAISRRCSRAARKTAAGRTAAGLRRPYQKRFLTAGSLSFGQQKLLEFAMALMREPKVLLLDEPTAGINPTLINGLIDRLKRAVANSASRSSSSSTTCRSSWTGRPHLLPGRRTHARHGRPSEIQNDKRVLNAYLGENYGSEAA